MSLRCEPVQISRTADEDDKQIINICLKTLPSVTFLCGQDRAFNECLFYFCRMNPAAGGGHGGAMHAAPAASHLPGGLPSQPPHTPAVHPSAPHAQVREILF